MNGPWLGQERHSTWWAPLPLPLARRRRDSMAAARAAPCPALHVVGVVSVSLSPSIGMQNTSHGRDTGEMLDNVISFSNYTDVNGLKVPSKVTYEDGIDYEVSFQFNVTYDPGVLVNPPTIEAGPEAWRPKRNR